MSILPPQSFFLMIDQLLEDSTRREACLRLPRDRWWIPASESGLDFSVNYHGRTVGTPLGMRIQMNGAAPRNLLHSWLSGGRILEVDALSGHKALQTAPRPSGQTVDVGLKRNPASIASTELMGMERQTMEYVAMVCAAGAFLIAIAEHLQFPHGVPDAPVSTHFTQYNLVVGYNVEDVQTRDVSQTILSLKDASSLLDSLRRGIPSRLSFLRDLKVDSALVRTAMLSTRPEASPDEIEKMAVFLMKEFGLNTVVKFHPALLGRDRLEDLLCKTLGYRSFKTSGKEFEKGLKWKESLDLARRLETTAQGYGVECGIQFTGDPSWENHRDDSTWRLEPTLRTSEEPWYVIGMTLADEWRRAAQWKGSVSFSGGVDLLNLDDVLSCGFIPVCVDVRKGGAGEEYRGAEYLRLMEDRLRATEAIHWSDYILRVERMGIQAVNELLDESGRRARAGTGLPCTQLPDTGRSESSSELDRLRKCVDQIERLNLLLAAEAQEISFDIIFGTSGETQDWSQIAPEDLPAAEAFYRETATRAALLNGKILAARAREDSRYHCG